MEGIVPRFSGGEGRDCPDMDYIAVFLITSSQLSIEITACDAAVVTSEVSPKPSLPVASFALLVESQAGEVWAVL